MALSLLALALCLHMCVCVCACAHVVIVHAWSILIAATAVMTRTCMYMYMYTRTRTRTCIRTRSQSEQAHCWIGLEGNQLANGVRQYPTRTPACIRCTAGRSNGRVVQMSVQREVVCHDHDASIDITCTENNLAPVT